MSANDIHENDSHDSEKVYVDKAQNFYHGEYVVKQLGISEKTLITLAESGEFDLGRIAGKIIVKKDTLMKFLDRYHFKGKESKDDQSAVDAKGKVKKHLTYVGDSHDNIPKVYMVKEYASKIGIDERTFKRHCDHGTFHHYRIGTLYKMSEEDFQKSLVHVTITAQKSNRGRGRPSKVHKIIRRYAKKDKSKSK